ncbi:MAG: CotH kinase family protein [Myxococcota bacterium]
MRRARGLGHDGRGQRRRRRRDGGHRGCDGRARGQRQRRRWGRRDGRAEDTAVADTAVADTALADTAVADTAVADTAVADTAVADPAAEDASVVDDALAPPDVVDPPPTYPKDCADLYAQTLLPTFEIEMDPGEWSGMRDDCANGVQQYRPIIFHYGSQAVDAQVRLKGNWSWSCDKMQFVVSFNEVDPQARFHGLRKLVVDAPWYDPTVLRERLAMDMLRRHGAPYSCVNNARVVVNGEFYGLYANLERMDHEYLERHFADDDGNLYQAGQELKTNEDNPDRSDIDAYWAASDVDTFAALADLPHAVTVWAGEAMLPDLDGYWAGVDINWYIYHHPTRGLLYLTYDADISFAENIWPEAVHVDPILWEHPGWKREPQYRMVMSDPSWCMAFEDALRHARTAYDVPLMQAQIDTWSAQIADAITDDPHKTFSLADHDTAVDQLRVFVAERAAFVDEWLASEHCPVTWPE